MMFLWWKFCQFVYLSSRNCGNWDISPMKHMVDLAANHSLAHDNDTYISLRPISYKDIETITDGFSFLLHRKIIGTIVVYLQFHLLKNYLETCEIHGIHTFRCKERDKAQSTSMRINCTHENVTHQRIINNENTDLNQFNTFARWLMIFKCNYGVCERAQTVILFILLGKKDFSNFDRVKMLI